MKNKEVKVIFDTNVLISFFIINRDPKDNFLLDLIDYSKADYLVTGDKDLLAHNPFKTAKILTPTEFDKGLMKENPNR